MENSNFWNRELETYSISRDCRCNWGSCPLVDYDISDVQFSDYVSETSVCYLVNSVIFWIFFILNISLVSHLDSKVSSLFFKTGSCMTRDSTRWHCCRLARQAVGRHITEHSFQRTNLDTLATYRKQLHDYNDLDDDDDDGKRMKGFGKKECFPF
jgi:hypothetical protein